jgi:hypothetical protein
MDYDPLFRWLREFHLPAIAAALISVAYSSVSAPSQSLARRALASAHAAAIALLYSGAWFVYLKHHAHEGWARTFAALALVPVGLMIVSFHLFRGNGLTLFAADSKRALPIVGMAQRHGHSDGIHVLMQTDNACARSVAGLARRAAIV